MEKSGCPIILDAHSEYRMSESGKGETLDRSIVLKIYL